MCVYRTEIVFELKMNRKNHFNCSKHASSDDDDDNISYNIYNMLTREC